MQNIKPLPDLSGWHPVPDDATVPVGMQVAARRRDDGYTEIFPVSKWGSNPANRQSRVRDYFTSEPILKPPPPLPTEPGTWIVADLRNGQEDRVLTLTENGTWSGVTDNESVVWVPASHIEDWREIKWVPSDEPEPVQWVEFGIDDDGASDPCGEDSPDNIGSGWPCSRAVGHPNLHVASGYEGVVAIWGEVAG